MIDERVRASLIRDFRAFLPHNAVVDEQASRQAFSCDGLTAKSAIPPLVLLPETETQLKGILEVCRRHSVPLVPRGAGTGLSGGATPDENAVLLSLSRMNRVLEIDPQNMLARVEPGVTNLSISQAVKPFGLFYAPDPSSQIACSIGGNVAENSGGVHCLKYGLTVHNILAIKVLTAEGDELVLGGCMAQSPGYDLLALFNGSEGLLGVITEITVKLLPLPESINLVMAAFDSVDDCAHAVSAIISAGIIPAGLEMMDRIATNAARDFVKVDYPDAAAILLCEIDGDEDEVTASTEDVKNILKKQGATRVKCAYDADQQARLWAGRKAAFPAVGRISPDYYCMDGTIPRKHLADVLKGIRVLAEAYQLRVANVFHAGDGNLHPLILYDASIPGELDKAEEFGGRILELCLEAGGSITGEHGVGVEKLDQMCLQFSDVELELMHAVKAAFDPSALLNPGKAVPELHRCAEFGAMHVHLGQLPFPDLPRF